ncbi:hypothetical protein C4G60_RS06455 [Vibrio parahaemolyticus]|uniref:hypothetical protein n=1 Tax=Vibrio kanaloae TaxID=170673 RepID=UPI0009889773|nr:hypothetical protein [Vibrio kanaloae]EJG0915642.1 hypothetical protein [Vibrio parahaemolyticus]QPK04248.1 hypothetical protein BTD91_13545 [Vibrio kanaloae]CAH8189376.1 conserved hypothetical protein [Vibrio aestuarianus]
MKKSPVIISLFLIALALFGSYHVYNVSNDMLPTKDKVTAYITIVATLGALISAAFVVFTYIHTSAAYVESQRPHLLTFMQNSFNQHNQPMSTLQYHNVTQNRFNDLTIDIKVMAANRTYSLSELFRSNMAMIGYDQRQRTFDPIQELNNLGLNLQQVAGQGNEVSLEVSYSYTFNGVKDSVLAQMYRWNLARNEWEIA